MTTSIRTEVMSEVSAKVDSFTGHRPVFSVNQDGSPLPIGNVRYTDYENDRHIRGIWFESDLDGKPHSLGAATSRFQVLSHYDVVKPFLDNGFQVRSVMHASGGATFMAFLSNPDVTFPDPIDWDLYSGAVASLSELRGLPLEQSVRIRSDLRRGNGVSVDVGFFRLICTNGLVARVMDLGHANYNHVTFDPENVEVFIGETILPTPDSLPSAPSALLRDVREFLGADDPGVLPRLLRDPVSGIQSSSSSATTLALIDELGEIEDRRERFSHLDLVNAVTNTKLAARTEWSVYRDLDSVMRNLTDLVELAAVRQGEWGFTKN